MKLGRVQGKHIETDVVLGFHPEWIHPTVWVAPGAVVTGEVHLDERVSIWYGAIVRGDVAPIYIGPRSNVQDGCIIHVDHGMPAHIGADVVMGHGAIVHAATVEDGCLIGIRSTVLSGCVVGEGSIIGAGAVVTEGTAIPPRSLVLGIPGRVARQVSREQALAIREVAGRYVVYSRMYSSHLDDEQAVTQSGGKSSG
jgi:carbonic anhydrase/acetyltransferase-like protein (isoleucine patch superfamily)